jgi:hypothetical protein
MPFVRHAYTLILHDHASDSHEVDGGVARFRPYRLVPHPIKMVATYFDRKRKVQQTFQ